ncbi:MAG TPA: hypothetical protein VFZ50_03535 [Actinomycetota bacterium]|nr:hypothetical protein [Actinomycetota bacterium]
MNRGGLRHLGQALARGAEAFLVLAAIGQALAFGARIVAGTGPSAVTTARIGAIYVGAFNHVAIEVRAPDDASMAGGSGSTSVSIGVALLAVTAFGLWLVFRSGRSVAQRAGGTVSRRMLFGAAVAPAYAALVFALALLVEVRTSLRIGGFSSPDLRVSLSAWQALVFPFCLAAAAGASGGVASALASAEATVRLRAARAAIAGGWRMFVLGVALSIGGLFVAGVAQADDAVAFLTPSTASYWRAVFDRPDIGVAAFAHHVAVLPNEAMWTLVPAMGGCDVIRGDIDADLLCYGRFAGLQAPASDNGLLLPVGDDGLPSRQLPDLYLAFLLVPALATLLGGRHAAAVSERAGRKGLPIGAASGLVFAALVAAGSLLSTVVITYGAAGGSNAGWVLFGPDALTGTALAIVWGCVGGAVGAATTSRTRTPTEASLDGGRNATGP